MKRQQNSSKGLYFLILLLFVAVAYLLGKQATTTNADTQPQQTLQVAPTPVIKPAEPIYATLFLSLLKCKDTTTGQEPILPEEAILAESLTIPDNIIQATLNREGVIKISTTQNIPIICTKETKTESEYKPEEYNGWIQKSNNTYISKDWKSYKQEGNPSETCKPKVSVNQAAYKNEKLSMLKCCADHYCFYEDTTITNIKTCDEEVHECKEVRVNDDGNPEQPYSYNDELIVSQTAARVNSAPSSGRQYQPRIICTDPMNRAGKQAKPDERIESIWNQMDYQTSNHVDYYTSQLEQYTYGTSCTPGRLIHYEPDYQGKYCARVVENCI